MVSSSDESFGVPSSSEGTYSKKKTRSKTTKWKGNFNLGFDGGVLGIPRPPSPPPSTVATSSSSGVIPMNLEVSMNSANCIVEGEIV